jgi:hypothetical protein
MTPFAFDRNVKLATMRIGVDAGAPKEFVDVLKELGAVPKDIAARPSAGGGGLNVESAAAFDSYVQWKAKELNIDLATIPEPQRGGGAGGAGGGAAGGAAAAGGGAAGAGRAGRAGGAPTDPGRPTGMAALTRWTGGRFPRAFDFIQQQRRRQILISQMAELLKDFDMYVPGGGYDVGLHAQTGHPCVVLPYKFDSPPSGGGGGRAGAGGAAGGGAAGAAGAAAASPTPQPSPVVYNKQPICAVIAGNLYNDDKILSVAHQYQLRTNWHKNKPTL